MAPGSASTSTSRPESLDVVLCWDVQNTRGLAARKRVAASRMRGLFSSRTVDGRILHFNARASPKFVSGEYFTLSRCLPDSPHHALVRRTFAPNPLQICARRVGTGLSCPRECPAARLELTGIFGSRAWARKAVPTLRVEVAWRGLSHVGRNTRRALHRLVCSRCKRFYGSNPA
ncbi:MAG: hypothetical protein ACI8WM_001992 [Burkholderiaceae bacterium]